MQFEHLDPIIIACFRHNGKHLPDVTDSTWENMILWASPRRLLGRAEGINGVGLLWDDPRFFPPHMRRYDVGVPIDATDVPNIDEPGFVLLTMPGEYMKVTHKGPYNQLLQAYDQALGLPLQAANLELVAAPVIEIYRNSPSEVATDELITDLYFPVVQL